MILSIWRQLTRGLRALTQRPTVDREIADEVQHYLDEAAATQMADGLSREQAYRAARLELGSEVSVREQVRGYGWENAIETVYADLRYAGRRLRAEPGFTIVAAFTLALGIGGTTAIFSTVNPILFESLPYPDADRITMIWERGDDGRRLDGTFGMYSELAAQSRSFADLAALKSWQPTSTGGEQPERFHGQRVSSTFFRVLGVSPLLGRDFHAAEDRLNGDNVVILSDGLWRRRFQADRAIIGRAITLDDNSYVVIGVMPPAFENALAPAAELWAPLQYDISQGRAWGHHLRIVGRLRSGFSREQASREVNAIAQSVLQEQKPETYGAEVELITPSLQQHVTHAVRPALLAILGAVSLVLIIACVNVTNLVLARGARRRAEFALRAALGAGRRRLMHQLLIESLLLAAIGGVLGIGVAALAIRALVALSPANLPRVDAIELDTTVFAFALTITTLIGLAVGLIPAIQAARSDPQRALQDDSRRTVGGHRRTRSALVVAEVALALVLLVTSGLLLRSLQRLFAVDIGFDSANVITLQVQASGQRFASDSTTYRFFAQALEAVRRVPGVTSAALTSQLPLSGDFDLFGVHFDPVLTDDPGEVQGTFRYAVSPGYIELMRIPVRRGRSLTEQDHAGAPRVALISESMANRRLRGLDPIGRRIRIGGGAPYTIVGIVGDVKQMSLALNESDAVYINAVQWRFADNVMSLVVRSRGNAADLASAIRAAVWSVDKDQAIVRVATMEELLAASGAERRFALILFEAFALGALLLAAAGIYGVLSGSVNERTREIGVRSALGASRKDVLSLVLRQGMMLVVAGLVIGLACAAAGTRAIGSLLFAVSPLDPITFLGVTALLAVIALIACGVPALRAARIDPATTLRLD